MIKRITIGDPHGRWKPIQQIYDKEQPDEVIILGDYFDSFNLDAYTQRECYENIIELRKEHLSKKKGRFIMLIGNHDMHYMDESFGRCSGWNQLTYLQAQYALCRDWDAEILKMIFVDEINKTIYSHAGVSMKWFNQYCKSLGDINTLDTEYFRFTYRDGGDCYGSSVWNSPLWIRPEGLKQAPYTEWDGNIGMFWSQIFGHTESNTPIFWKECNAEFWGIDCINTAYLVEILDNDHELINRYIEYLY